MSGFVFLAACQSDILSLEQKSEAGTQAESAQVEQPKASDEPNADAVVDPFDRVERVPSQSLVLAMSWQPGFCEGHEKKSECQSQHEQRYDAKNFALHGLWPQPGSKVYCNVSKIDRSRDKRGNWLDLPAVQISVRTKQRLDKVMPGTRSALDRHEWIKHGTCYSKGAETYYRDSLTLMDKINSSSVRNLFAANIGESLTAKQIRGAFDKAFGRGTGKRVRISCKRDGNRQLITELTLGLRGVVGSNPNIGRLAKASRTIGVGCPRGIVDPVGLQ